MSLEIKELTKRFGAKTAVDALSLSLREPGVYGLIGTNGAGKTTTIRMLLGMLPADGGSALWNGAAIPQSGLRYGYMPEERGIYMKTRVGEQLVYFARLRGMRKADAMASADRLLDRLGVAEYKSMLAEKLSKGNQQKIQLIATLLHDPDLLILDEPFSGLDPLNTQLFRELIEELASKGKYIILSSHQMAVVEEYCREITLLHRGKTILQGDLRRIKAGYGHTKLVVAVPDAALDMAQSFGLRVTERRAAEADLALPPQDADARAEEYLKAMLAAGILPAKFQLSEPTLHEIFIEKVGEAVEGGAAA
ncbi:MAG: ATP-binding cassette domain-containing protein [Oscillospiraceae bacterium]|jgi:ABC-2 type transport system ATP-binding protein|nr:ATP-binding cassette domain-containing protein [Oscillospiraceae bacterium]